MHGVTDVDDCEARRAHCLPLALSCDSSTASAAVGQRHTITCHATDPADNGSKSIAMSAAVSANIDKHTGDEFSTMCCTQSSASANTLCTPVDDAVSPVADAANSTSSSISEPTPAESPFHFSVAGYNFQKYTNMVIVSQLTSCNQLTFSCILNCSTRL